MQQNDVYYFVLISNKSVDCVYYRHLIRLKLCNKLFTHKTVFSDAALIITWFVFIELEFLLTHCLVKHNMFSQAKTRKASKH